MRVEECLYKNTNVNEALVQAQVKTKSVGSVYCLAEICNCLFQDHLSNIKLATLALALHWARHCGTDGHFLKTFFFFFFFATID